MAFIPLTKEQYQKAIGSGFTHQQIIEMEKQRKSQNAEQPKGYLSRVFEEYTKAGQEIISGVKQSAEEIQKGLTQGGIGGAVDVAKGLGRAGLRTVGEVTGAAFAPITEAPVIKPAIETIGTGISKIPGVDIIVQKATELAKKHPESAKDLQNIIDIAIIGIGSGAQKPIGTALGKTGVALEESGVNLLRLLKIFVQKLVIPIESRAVKLEQVKRTTEAKGFFKEDIVTPTQSEIKMAEEVAQISGVSSKNTFQKNFNVVRDYNVKQAKQLEADIAQYDFSIPKQTVISKLDEATKSLESNPLIVGDAEKTANKLVGGAKKFIESNEASGSGLLKARKEYDNWVLSQKPKAFDARAENAFTIANKTVRDTINTTLDENAINLGVKDSLKRQSSLYRAMDNIGPKAAQEANTPLLRALERVGKILGIKSHIVQGIAAAVGIGGLGAAATFAPPVAILGITGFVVYKAGKLVMSPQVRIALGRLLQEAGHLISPVDKKIFQDALDIYK